MARLTTLALLAPIAVFASACSLGAGLGVTSPTPFAGYRSAPAPQPEYQGSHERLPKATCGQELGQDTGSTADQASEIDGTVQGCFPENDDHDAFLVKVKKGPYTLTLHALDDVAMHVSVYEVGGKRILFESIDGNETLEKQLDIRHKGELFVKIDAFNSGDDPYGRYELKVQPE